MGHSCPVECFVIPGHCIRRLSSQAATSLANPSCHGLFKLVHPLAPIWRKVPRLPSWTFWNVRDGNHSCTRRLPLGARNRQIAGLAGEWLARRGEGGDHALVNLVSASPMPSQAAKSALDRPLPENYLSLPSSFWLKSFDLTGIPGRLRQTIKRPNGLM